MKVTAGGEVWPACRHWHDLERRPGADSTALDTLQEPADSNAAGVSHQLRSQDACVQVPQVCGPGCAAGRPPGQRLVLCLIMSLAGSSHATCTGQVD